MLRCVPHVGVGADALRRRTLASAALSAHDRRVRSARITCATGGHVAGQLTHVLGEPAPTGARSRSTSSSSASRNRSRSAAGGSGQLSRRPIARWRLRAIASYIASRSPRGTARAGPRSHHGRPSRRATSRTASERIQARGPSTSTTPSVPAVGSPARRSSSRPMRECSEANRMIPLGSRAATARTDAWQSGHAPSNSSTGPTARAGTGPRGSNAMPRDYHRRWDRLPGVACRRSSGLAAPRRPSCPTSFVPGSCSLCSWK